MRNDRHLRLIVGNLRGIQNFAGSQDPFASKPA
jgi:hypothetical protein